MYMHTSLVAPLSTNYQETEWRKCSIPINEHHLMVIRHRKWKQRKKNYFEKIDRIPNMQIDSYMTLNICDIVSMDATWMEHIVSNIVYIASTMKEKSQT